MARQKLEKSNNIKQEREGFEPSVNFNTYKRLAILRDKPLCHLSFFVKNFQKFLKNMNETKNKNGFAKADLYRYALVTQTF